MDCTWPPNLDRCRPDRNRAQPASTLQVSGAGCSFRGVEASAGVVLHVVLDRPEDEERLLAWWDELLDILAERYRLADSRLFVARRGELVGMLEFPVPGAWTLLAQDRRWAELQGRRPPSRLEVTQLRRVARDGEVRTMTTTCIESWLLRRDRGQHDFALVDVLGADDFARAHIRGSLSLPGKDLGDEDRVRAVLGTDLDRPVVVYCSGYG